MPCACEPSGTLCRRLPRRGRRGRGRALRACPLDEPITRAVTELLGPRKKSPCSMVSSRTMYRELRRHDWPKNTNPNTFLGFHTDYGRILVQDPRSVLHERVHDWINDEKIARWLCEALDEEVSEHLHEEHGFPWVPTYPELRRVLRDELLPRLGVDGVELARIVADPDPAEPPARWMARTIVQNDARLARRGRALLRALGPRGGDDTSRFLELLS